VEKDVNIKLLLQMGIAFNITQIERKNDKKFVG
jgi:hypothetical protein